jgi:hypothetical protein
MKLFELITPTQKSITLDRPYKPSVHGKRSDDAESKGSMSYVKPAKDPHRIHKFQRHPSSESNKDYRDGFSVYAQYILDYDLANKSAFFPRVYKKVKKTFPDKDVLHSYEIERLVHFHQTAGSKEDYDSGDELDDVENNRKKGIKTYDWKAADQQGEYIAERYLNDDVEPNFNVLTARIEEACETGDYSDFRPGTGLIEAIQILREIQKKEPKLIWDIHDYNLMLRPGKYGSQLVFADPFL